ncbi:MAG: c-type cytochrome [Candidatus Binatia bacterium]
MRASGRMIAGVLVLAAASGAARADGDPALDYMLNCQGCHRAEGAGTAGSVPALSGSVARFLAVPEGREFLVRVPGVAQSVLDDERLAALLNWLVTRFDAGHVPKDFRRYTAAEVARLRRRPLTDVEGLRRRLLADIEPSITKRAASPRREPGGEPRAPLVRRR